MPFLPQNPYDDEAEKKKQEGTGQNISGQSGTFALPGASQTANTPKAPQRSGSFANLNQYLDANKDNTNQMATSIAGSIDNTAQNAQSNIDAFKANAPTVINRVTNDDLKNNYYDNATSLNDVIKNQYKILKGTGGYTGPTDVSGVAGYEDAVSSANTATSKLAQTGTEAGRQELLKNQYSRPSYTQGQNVLDQALIQADPNAQQKITGVKDKWSALNGLLDKTVNNSGSLIQQNLQNVLDNKAAIDTSETDYLNSFINPITQRANDLKTNAPKIQASVRNDLTDRTVNQDTIDRLGLGNYLNSSIYNLDLGSYLTDYDASGVNENVVATVDERNKYAALTSLLDRDPTQIQSAANPYSPTSFDETKFKADLASQSAEAAADKNILKREYLMNPNALGGYAATIPGALTQRRDINEASMSDLKSFWIPLYRQAQAQWPQGSMYGFYADAMEKSIGDWERLHGTNNILKKE